MQNKNQISDTLRRISSSEGYFSAGTYLGFLFGKLKKGELWNTAVSVYRKIRKYTLISAVVRTVAIIVSLLEKSALLLLFATSVLLLLPAILTVMLICTVTCVVKYVTWHKTVSAWLKNADKITVYLSSERIFVGNAPLFLRVASEEASSYLHPVIVLCSDPFASVKWYSLNLLAIRPDYFFLLKKLYFGKKGLDLTVISLS